MSQRKGGRWPGPVQPPGVSEALWASTGWIRLEAAAAHPRPLRLSSLRGRRAGGHHALHTPWPLCSWWPRFLAVGPYSPPPRHRGAGVRLGASSGDSSAHLRRDAPEDYTGQVPLG